MRIFLAGDSLVKEYKEEEFIAGWGQYLSQMSDVEILNYAEGGRSTRLFINEGRLNCIARQLQKGDYFLIEFCHNDDESKEYKTMFNRLTPLGLPDETGRYPLIPGQLADKRYLPKEYLDKLYADEKIADKQAVIQSIYGMFDQYPGELYYPYSSNGSKGTYKWFLKQFIDVARNQNAIPVLVTPPARTVFTENGKIADGDGLHGGDHFCYVRAIKQIAEETGTPVIDLFEISRALFEKVGSKNIHYLTSIKKGINKGVWPDDFNREINKTETVSEDTHLNKYGAYLLTCNIIEAVHAETNNQLDELKKHLHIKENMVECPKGFSYK